MMDGDFVRLNTCGSSCRIYRFSITSSAGVETVGSDRDPKAKIYDMSGRQMDLTGAEALPARIYVVYDGDTINHK